MPSSFFSEQVSAGLRDSHARLVPRHFGPAFPFPPAARKLSWIPGCLPSTAPLAWLRTSGAQLAGTIFSCFGEHCAAGAELCPPLWLSAATAPLTCCPAVALALGTAGGRLSRAPLGAAGAAAAWARAAKGKHSRTRGGPQPAPLG